jgi:isoquinoline 1-oxidoreductase alpha subunit
MTGTKWVRYRPAALHDTWPEWQLVLASVTDGAVGRSAIVTIEAMSSDPVGRRIQDACVDRRRQCGYVSGQIMTAVALLKTVPKPTDAQIEQSMGGNICRCGTYVRIRQAIRSVSQQLG